MGSNDAGSPGLSVHRRGQVGDGLGQHRRAAPDVARRDQVGHVDDVRVRRDPGTDPVAGGHETVLEPVVGEEAQVAKTVHDP